MAITSQDIKALRDMTGAGMMDCKRALEEANGDRDQAVEILRKKGQDAALKRAGRQAEQGTVVSYIHGEGTIGVLVELNCETDFVARTDDFRELARELAMQVAAMNPSYVDRDQVPPQVLEKELEIYREQARGEGKPDHILDRIAEGKLEKFYQQACLLEQEYVRDDNRSVRDLITDTIGRLGENIVVRRFVRFALGESAQGE